MLKLPALWRNKAKAQNLNFQTKKKNINKIDYATQNEVLWPWTTNWGRRGGRKGMTSNEVIVLRNMNCAFWMRPQFFETLGFVAIYSRNVGIFHLFFGFSSDECLSTFEIERWIKPTSRRPFSMTQNQLPIWDLVIMNSPFIHNTRITIESKWIDRMQMQGFFRLFFSFVWI